MIKESSVGKRIRSYRENLDMSVYDLSQKCGIDEKVINSIEKGEVLPALGVLTKISRALGQRLGTFMDDQFKPDPIITRASDLEAGKVAGEGVNTLGYSSHSLALGKPDRHMDPFHILLADGAERSFSSHEGEELIICISGKVEVACGDTIETLAPGDSAYYDSVVRHSVRAIGGPAAIYGIICVPC